MPFDKISGENGVEDHGSSAGIGFWGFGSMLAITLSWSVNHSILWMILHGVLSWLSVIYYAIKRYEQAANSRGRIERMRHGQVCTRGEMSASFQRCCVTANAVLTRWRHREALKDNAACCFVPSF